MKKVNIKETVSWNLILAATAFFLLNSCGLHQDPFNGQPDNVRNAVPPVPPVPEKTTPSDFAVVDAPNYIYFTEGKQSVVTVGGRVFIPNNGYEVQVDGLPTGAVFDAAKGEIRWTPPMGFIKTSTRTTFDIDVSVVVHAQQTMRLSKSVFVIVEKSFSVPSITSTVFDFDITEGKSKEFDVTVVDVDSDGVKTPDVIARTNTNPDGSPYFKILSQIFQNGQWIFHVSFDLKTAEVTSSYSPLEFQLIAYSVLGIPSAPMKVSARVWSNASPPAIAWIQKDIPELTQGLNLLKFSVYDPKSEGTVTVQTSTIFKNLPNAPTFACTDDGGNKVCAVAWTIPTIAPSKLAMKQFDIVIQATNNVENDYQTVEFTRTVNVPTSK